MGGMTSSILTDSQKITVAEIRAQIETAQSVLLHCHPNPDPDSVGSVLAMREALLHMGKEVTIIRGDSTIPEAFMHFPDAHVILPQNYFETNKDAFDLFVILDCGSLEMISKKGEVTFPSTLRTIVIDHHASNQGYGEINLVATQYPATTEILFDIFKEWNIKITENMALQLYVGLYTDTGGFRYELVTAHSFEMAAELAHIAPGFTNILKRMENNATEGGVTFLSSGLNNREVYAFPNADKGSYVVTCISQEDILELNLTQEDFWNAGFVTNILRSVVGWNVIAILTEQQPGEVKVSLRTRDAVLFDVSKVALFLGGGGHKAASGATIKASIDEAKDKVKEAIVKVLG